MTSELVRVWVAPSFGVLVALGMGAGLLVLADAEVNPVFWAPAAIPVDIDVDVAAAAVVAAVDTAASVDVDGADVFDDPPQPATSNRVETVKTAARRTMIPLE